MTWQLAHALGSLRQVRAAARIDEGVAAQPQQQAEDDADGDRVSRLHARIIAAV